MEEYQRSNQIKIADRDIRIYLGEIMIALQVNDEVELTAVDSYCEKMIAIADMFSAVAVHIDPRYMKNGRKIIIKETLEGVKNMRTGRIGNIIINKLGLLKDPELFRFTSPDKDLSNIKNLIKEKA